MLSCAVRFTAHQEMLNNKHEKPICCHGSWCGSQAVSIMSITMLISDLILNWPQRYENIKLLKGSQILLFINGQLFLYIFIIILSFYSCLEHKAFMKLFCWVLSNISPFVSFQLFQYIQPHILLDYTKPASGWSRTCT